MSNLKILYGYSWFESEAYGNIQELSLSYFNRLNEAGFDVEGFCLTLNPPGNCLSFKEMDKRWRRGDKVLLELYERLEKALEGKDVLINGPGINLHPEFVEKLPVFTVFQCFDDPESSANLSRPVAAAYDLCLVGNIAEVGTYRSWGVKHAEWSPMGLLPNIYDSKLTYDDILNGERDIDLFMMIDRLAPLRKERLDKLAQAFPAAHFYGKGWPRGYLSNDKEIAYLSRAKIGPNIHNSTGPINYRTFYLPANGVMQICDNKSHLGMIYELDKEVVGFDSIEECIDLCRYYNCHDFERKTIAANGWKRAISDYSEIAVFKKNIINIAKSISGTEKDRKPAMLNRREKIISIGIKNKFVDICNEIENYFLGYNKKSSDDNNACVVERNIGENILEWPDRLNTAIGIISKYLLNNGSTEVQIADYGCGKQTLRKLMPPNWKYTPYDYCKRSNDTIICDFDSNRLPESAYDAIFCMGVLEYLERPFDLLQHAINKSTYLIISYNGFTNDGRRIKQGWKNSLTFSELDEFIDKINAIVLEKKHIDNNEWIYLIKRGV